MLSLCIGVLNPIIPYPISISYGVLLLMLRLVVYSSSCTTTNASNFTVCALSRDRHSNLHCPVVMVTVYTCFAYHRVEKEPVSGPDVKKTRTMQKAKGCSTSREPQT